MLWEFTYPELRLKLILAAPGTRIDGDHTSLPTARWPEPRQGNRSKVLGGSAESRMLETIGECAKVRKARSAQPPSGTDSGKLAKTLAVTGRAIRARLRDSLRTALRRSKSGRIVLEIGPGGEGLAKEIEACGHSVLKIVRPEDLPQAPGDVASRIVQGWISSRVVEALIISTGPGSFSRYSALPCRSAACPRGLPSLYGATKRLVTTDNKFADALATLMHAAYDCNIPGLDFGPAASFSWNLALRSSFTSRLFVEDAVADLCLFGAVGRFRTRLKFWHWNEAAAVRRSCGGRFGCCDFTGRRHLIGRQDRDRDRVAAEVQKFPPLLCRLLAGSLHALLGRTRINNIWTVWKSLSGCRVQARLETTSLLEGGDEIRNG